MLHACMLMSECLIPKLMLVERELVLRSTYRVSLLIMLATCRTPSLFGQKGTTLI